MLIQVIFWLVSGLALLGGLGVILLREPIRSVLSLVGTMLALSVLFLLLSAQFVFVVQIIIYAGAVMVLFLFVVALLGPSKEQPSRRLQLHWAFSLLAALVFLGLLWALLRGIPYRVPDPGSLDGFGTIEAVGAGLFGPYLFPFELTSILLLVAAVGAIYLSRGREDPSPSVGEAGRSPDGGEE